MTTSAQWKLVCPTTPVCLFRWKQPRASGSGNRLRVVLAREFAACAAHLPGSMGTKRNGITERCLVRPAASFSRPRARCGTGRPHCGWLRRGSAVLHPERLAHQAGPGIGTPERKPRPRPKLHQACEKSQPIRGLAEEGMFPDVMMPSTLERV